MSNESKQEMQGFLQMGFGPPFRDGLGREYTQALLSHVEQLANSNAHGADAAYRATAAGTILGLGKTAATNVTDALQAAQQSYRNGSQDGERFQPKGDVNDITAQNLGRGGR